MINTVINLTAAVACIKNAHLMLAELLPSFSYWVTKLILFVAFLTMISLIIEPERLKPITLPATLLFLALVFTYFSDAIVKTFGGDAALSQQRSYRIADYNNGGLFLGISSYSFESIGTIFNGRQF